MTGREVFKNAEKKVVFIGLEKEIGELDNQKAVNIVGSGFLVKDAEGNKLITAGHVLSQARSMANAENVRIFVSVFKNKDNGIVSYDFKDINKNEFRIDGKNDLGFVPLNEINKDNLYILENIQLSNDYAEGVKCISVGFPLLNEFLSIGVGITLFVSSSMIASVKYNAERRDVDFILTDSHVNPSSSGSPLFDESTGKIIGVVAGTFQNNFVGPVMAEKKVQTGVQVPRNIGLIRPSYYLKDLLACGAS